MKLIIGLLLLAFALGSTGSCIAWHCWWYPRTYEYALNLADDASLPADKAAHLGEYLDRVSDITGPPRYIFTRPDLDLKKQRIILQGLITRFEDIAKLSPGEMAYQQGMFQLTGQEIDHQLKRISGIFKAAKLRETGILFIWFYVFSIMAWLGILPCLPWDDVL